MLHRIVHRLVMKGVRYVAFEAIKSVGTLILDIPAHIAAQAAERVKESLKSEEQRRFEAQEEQRLREEYERGLIIRRQRNKVATKIRAVCWLCWICGIWGLFSFTDTWWAWLFLPVVGLVVRAVGLNLGYKYDEYV